MRAAAELAIPERTLRRAASEGLVRGERLSPRRFRITLREEAYLRSHWTLLGALRGALRTEPNVRLAVLFGSTATGSDHDRSDVDVLVVLHDPDVGRLAELAERLSRRVARRDLDMLREAGVISGELARRLQRLRELRRMLVHEYATATAEQVHESALIVTGYFPAFYDTYRAWIRGGFAAQP